MSDTVTIDDTRFQEQLQRLADVVPIDAQTLIKDEARLFLKQAIGLTPPKTRAQGEQAIRDDINRVLTGANEDFLLYEFANQASVDQWFTNRKGEKVHAQFDHLDINGRGAKSWHERNRNARGRIPSGMKSGSKQGENWKASYVVSYAAKAAEIARSIAKVGIRKSGWAASYIFVGGKTLPDWVKRHMYRNAGDVQGNLDSQSPWLLMSSHAPGCLGDERILTNTFRARGEAIGKRIRLIVSGYSKDVQQKIKIQKHARATPE